ncbi:MAG: hypothetical protein HOH95_07125, partial [Dehalococcoidia bacterium]|nr:hypothetical protein [Dehalococcoidia bacterium]
AGPLGALQVGPLVGAVGEQTALTIVVAEGLVMLLIAGAIWPMLRQVWTAPPVVVAVAEDAGG